METIRKIFTVLRNLFKKLNFEQCKVISDIFKGLALSSFVPVILKLITDDKAGDRLSAMFLLVCAMIASVMAVIVVAKEEE